MNEWFTLDQLLTMAVCVMPFALIFGALSAVNVLNGKEYGLWETFIHFGWLFSHAVALTSWPVILFASSIGMFSLATTSIELARYIAGTVMAVFVLLFALLPYFILPFRGKMPLFGKK